MATLLAISLVANAILVVYALYAQRGTFGVMGCMPGTLALKVLEFLAIPIAIIAFDMRKVHELILALGYENTTVLIRRFLKMRYGKRDFLFQKGGDEFIAFILFPGALTSERIVARMLENMDAVTASMTIAQREYLCQLTGGLVDRLSASIVHVPVTKAAYSASVKAMDAANAQKVGTVTGERATSGRAGTIISNILA